MTLSDPERTKVKQARDLLNTVMLSPTPPIRTIAATPATLANLLKTAKAGDLYNCAPGDYGCLTLSGLRGTAAAPITLIGATGALLTPNTRAQYYTCRDCQYVAIQGFKVGTAVPLVNIQVVQVP